MCTFSLASSASLDGGSTRCSFAQSTCATLSPSACIARPPVVAIGTVTPKRAARFWRASSSASSSFDCSICSAVPKRDMRCFAFCSSSGAVGSKPAVNVGTTTVDMAFLRTDHGIDGSKGSAREVPSAESSAAGLAAAASTAGAESAVASSAVGAAGSAGGASATGASVSTETPRPSSIRHKIFCACSASFAIVVDRGSSASCV